MKNINTLSGLSVANFSKQIDGKETALYTLCNKVGAELGRMGRQTNRRANH